MMKRHTLSGVVGMLVIVLGACGGTDTSSLDLSELETADQALVRVEAQWLCDAQRHAFADLSDMEAAQAGVMASFGVDAGAYDEFKARLTTDERLRSHVSAQYETTCESTGGAT